MAGRNPIVVPSIDDALGLLEDFEGAESFIVSPLSDKSGGGRPSWHVLRLDDTGEPTGWIRETEAEGKENVNFRVPTIDMKADDLPPLPLSKANLWLFVFGDKNCEKMEPRIIIDPSGDPSRQSHRIKRRETPKHPTEAAPPAQTATAATLPEAGILRALEIQSRANQQMMLQVQQLLATVTGSVEQLGKGHAHLGALLTDNLLRSEQRAEKAEELRDKTLLENDKLASALVEARSSGQGWLAFKDIYAGKPELLHEGLRDFAGGIVGALRTVLTAAEKSE
ncbi:MAG: hypothetical protein JNM40_22295 [Myxococcales bacterium]|nr:hypothetical protein [Myxococcales bacterium]